MKAHKFAELFPMMADKRVRELAADIKAHGLRDPIVILDGKILDGRQREKACKLAGVAPVYISFDKLNGIGTGGPLAYVMSENFHRRDLTESQRAMIGAEYKQRLASELKAQRESNKSPKPDLKATRGRPATGDLLTKAAKVVGVHRARVAEASKVLREAPEKVPAIKAGKLTVGKAVKQIEARKPKPKKDLSCGLTRDSSLRSLFGKADANGGVIYVEVGDYSVRVRRLTCAASR